MNKRWSFVALMACSFSFGSVKYNINYYPGKYLNRVLSGNYSDITCLKEFWEKDLKGKFTSFFMKISFTGLAPVALYGSLYLLRNANVHRNNLFVEGAMAYIFGVSAILSPFLAFAILLGVDESLACGILLTKSLKQKFSTNDKI